MTISFFSRAYSKWRLGFWTNARTNPACVASEKLMMLLFLFSDTRFSQGNWDVVFLCSSPLARLAPCPQWLHHVCPRFERTRSLFYQTRSERTCTFSSRNNERCAKWKIANFRGSTPVLRLVCSKPPRKSAYILYYQKLESLAYIFAADSVGLSTYKFLQWTA